jgi:hypothetical protein
MLVDKDRTAAAIASTWVLFVAAMGSTLDCVKRNIYNLNLLKTFKAIHHARHEYYLNFVLNEF